MSRVVFFWGTHSARHIIRTIDYSYRSSLGLILGAALLPMLGGLVASADASHLLSGTSLDARDIQLVFVGRLRDRSAHGPGRARATLRLGQRN